MTNKNHIILWCERCNTPFIEEGLSKCNICGEIGRPIAPDMRPVFARERAILEYFGHKIMHMSVWTNSKSRVYYANGKKIRLPRYDDYRDKNVEIKDYIDSRENELEKRDNELLEEYKKFYKASDVHLKELENTAFEFVQKVVKDYPNRLKMVSFSGGKDSTVVSDVVRRALGRDDILHVFGDTGIEDLNTYIYIQEFLQLYPKIPYFEGKSEQDFFDLVDHMGPPSRVMRWCCTVIKSGPITSFLRSIDDKVRVLTFYGIRHAESAKRAKYEQVSKGKKIGNQITASPIIDWLEFDVWGYIISNNVHFNKSYRLGYSRVGCWLCPMNSSWSEFLNSVHFQEDNKNWQNKLIEFAKVIGKPDAEVYVRDRKWAARQGGTGLPNRWTGIDIIPSSTIANSVEIKLKKQINAEVIEFLKPLGKIDSKRSEPKKGIYFINKNGNRGFNIKIIAKERAESVFVTALDSEDANNALMYAKYQFNKFQTCIKCTACAVACPYNAIAVHPGPNIYEIDADKCVNCSECITHFGSTGCLVAKSLSAKREFVEDKEPTEFIILDLI